jgi:hypothetical protein
MTDLQYPIGKFQKDQEVTDEKLQQWIDEISKAPAKLRAVLHDLTSEQLDIPYRPGGWTVRQVVHHLADSHLNNYMRFRLALTEEEPTIKPYYEDRWAELEDARNGPVEISIALLESLHGRWVMLLRSLNATDYERSFIHPENGVVRLNTNVGMYAWHGNHHIAHITALRERSGWIGGR